MWRAVERIRNGLDFAQGICTTIAIALILTFIFCSFVLRYFFASGIIWGEEISRVLFIFITYLAVSRVDARGLHFRVTVVHDLLPRAAPYLSIVVDIAQLAVLVCLAYLAARLAMQVGSMGQQLPASSLPAWYFYAPISIGIGLGALSTLIRLCGRIWHPSSGAGEGQRDQWKLSSH